MTTREVVNALDWRAGGADDNEAQAGHLVSFSNQGRPSEETGVRRLTPVECERLQGWPDGWTVPDGPSLIDAPTWLDPGYVPDERYPRPDDPRLSACGDGVTAPVAEWIGRRLVREAA